MTPTEKNFQKAAAILGCSVSELKKAFKERASVQPEATRTRDEISEIEDALWALHSYESNRDDGGRVYTEANITQMVETVRSFRSPTPEAVRVAFDQVNKLAAELASLRSASEAPMGHEQAQARIAECVREIQILCDQFGYDPYEWLADDDPGTASSAALTEQDGPALDAEYKRAYHTGGHFLDAYGSHIRGLKAVAAFAQSATASEISDEQHDEIVEMCAQQADGNARSPRIARFIRSLKRANG